MAQQFFSEIEYGSTEYEQSLALRDEVLRKPLGLRFSDEELQRERDHYHLVCQVGGQIIGCLVLVPTSRGELRMRQVAVVPELQRQGIGRALTEFAEGFARKRGFTTVTLHARDYAVGFYDKLGYQRLGEPFEEISLVHWKMQKQL